MKNVPLPGLKATSSFSEADDLLKPVMGELFPQKFQGFFRTLFFFYIHVKFNFPDISRSVKNHKS